MVASGNGRGIIPGFSPDYVERGRHHANSDGPRTFPTDVRSESLPFCLPLGYRASMHGVDPNPGLSTPDEAQDPKLPCVVCLGGSAGGLEALQAFFQEIPPNPGVPFVVVVHLSPDFKSLMPELLSRHTKMPVQTATDGTVIKPDHVYVISPGNNMAISGGKLTLHRQDRSPGHALNLPIDLFLTSLADEFYERSIAIILSGTGSDGSRGIRRIREAGGVILVQSPETAKFDGMPRSALQTGLVDRQGPPATLAKQVAELVRRPLPSMRDPNPAEDDEEAHFIPRIIELLKTASDLDLSYLRRRMLSRRIRRRMAIIGMEDIDDYLSHLADDAGELQRLGGDLLIGVTSFYRDRDAFDALQDRVMQDMLLGLTPDEILRVWVSACSSGDEAYSVAMLFLEAMAASGIQRNLKVFATDIDPRALERASRGTYTLSEAADIPVPLLSKYFEQNGNEYVVRTELRSKIIFAKHNIVEDPPFTRMHLVSCRNLLIYLNPAAQQKALHTLFTALKPDHGILFLGPAETPSPIGGGLTCLDTKAKIYKRTGILPHPITNRSTLPDPVSTIRASREAPILDSRTSQQVALLRGVLETMLETEQSSAAVIDRNNRVVEVLADPLSLFRLPKGKPTDELGRILTDELMTVVAIGQQQLSAGQKTANYLAAPRHGSGEELNVRLSRLPPLFASERGNANLSVLAVKAVNRPAEERPRRIAPSSVERVSALEFELRQTKESLQATIEELQSSNEEQQSTNEELMASNEELQSTNEELHSVNEELYTVNAEYHTKNQELLVLSADLNSLINSMSVATLYLDDQLTIRRFNPSISRIVSLQASDQGRPLRDFSNRLKTDLVSDAEAVLRTGVPIEREVYDRSGAWVLMRLSPYLTVPATHRGVLATFVDVTRIKNAEESARVMSEQLMKTNTKLTTKSEQLEDLISIIAHDLKRPVMSLDNYLKLAIRSLGPATAGGVTKRLETALDATKNIQRMLKDLSDISQLSHYEPKAESVDLPSWFDEQLRPFAAKAEKLGVSLRSTCDHGAVTFARAAATGILNNLVENALVHGTSDPDPRIDVACQVDGGHLRLTVVDNGRGIAEEHHERIFELFRRLRPDDSDGSGVGLVAARRFAQRVHGSVRVESELGRGAKFVAELPLRDLQKKPTSALDHPILLVEDDALDAKRVRVALSDFKIRWVQTLSDAVEETASLRYRLIILDLSLPDGHGLKLISHIANSDHHVPIIILSGQTEGLMDEALTSTSVVASMTKEKLDDPAFVETVRRTITG